MRASETDIEIAECIRAFMVANGKSLSTAESCTSGRIAASLTSVSGASDYFQGGMVVYQNQLKEKFLGVSDTTIANHDVVSSEVVTEMVKGCCRLFGTDYAIASTGYTGTGSDKVPSGTIWIGMGTATEVVAFCLTEDNGRETNTSSAAYYAIEKFKEYIISKQLNNEEL